MDRSLLSGWFSIFGTRVVMTLVTVVSTPLLYRLLGDSGVGTFATLMSVGTLVGIFVTAGITGGVRKFIAEDRDDDDWEELVVGFYFRIALALAAAGGLFMLLVGVLLTTTDLLPDAFEAQSDEAVFLYFAMLAVLMFSDQFRGYTRNTLRGFGLERLSEPLKVVQRTTFAVVAIGLVALGHGVVGAVTGRIVAGVVVAVVGFAYIAQRVPLRSVFRRTPPEFPRRQVWSFNSLSVVLIFLIMSLYHVDILMLQALSSSDKVGQYRAALTLAEFLWLVPLTIQALFVHSTSELWSKGRVEQITDIAGQTTRYVMLVTVVMGMGLAVLADEFVPFYFGGAFAPAVTPLLLLLPGALGFAVARPMLAIQQGKGDLEYPIAATGGAAALNFALNVVLIPRFGMAGAATATSIGYGSMLAFHLFVARRYVGFDPLANARVGRIAAAAVLSAPVLYATNRAVDATVAVPLFDGGVPLSLVVVPVVGAAAFFGAAFLTGALVVDEVLSLLSRFPGPVGSVARQVLGRS